MLIQRNHKTHPLLYWLTILPTIKGTYLTGMIRRRDPSVLIAKDLVTIRRHATRCMDILTSPLLLLLAILRDYLTPRRITNSLDLHSAKPSEPISQILDISQNIQTINRMMVTPQMMIINNIGQITHPLQLLLFLLSHRVATSPMINWWCFWTTTIVTPPRLLLPQTPQDQHLTLST